MSSFFYAKISRLAKFYGIIKYNLIGVMTWNITDIA